MSTGNGPRAPQEPRELPVIASADLAIAGGGTAAVAAALAATTAGARVFLAAPYPYPGEDLCATLRITRSTGAPPTSVLPDLFDGQGRTTPGRVKAILTERLVAAGVRFVFSATATDLLRDPDGGAAGILLANRAGRQAVTAPVVIDATDYAWLCRASGCERIATAGGPLRIERGLLRRAGIAGGAAGDNTDFDAETIAFEADAGDFSYSDLCRVEDEARARTPPDRLLRAADRIFCIPPFRIRCRRSAAVYNGDPLADAGAHFQPRDIARLFVLGGCADLPESIRQMLLQPAGLCDAGERLGRMAAALAIATRRTGCHPVPRTQPTQTPGMRSLPGDGSRGPPANAVDLAAVREVLSGARPLRCDGATIVDDRPAPPITNRVQVLVVGGGTAGSAAGIAAAREGMRTLVVDAQFGMGGIGTLGLIAEPYKGCRRGFAADVPFPRHTETKLEWYRQALSQAGGQFLPGATGCGAVVQGGVVTGAVIVTPEGRTIVSADVVIDATGSADIAIAAGAEYRYGDIENGDIALQGVGLAARDPGRDQRNSDILMVDESDLVDVTRAYASAYLANREAFDTVTLIQSRERRCVVADFTLRYADQIAGRTYADAVVLSSSDYDSHGYPSASLFALLPHDAVSRQANHPAPGGSCWTPYRCLLPQGLDGILVCGLGIGMERDAAALVRMQLDMANQGYAAGVAAAMAVRMGLAPRHIDVRALQRRLVSIGNLPAEVLGHTDLFPLADTAVHEAVAATLQALDPQSAGRPLGIIVTHPEPAVRALRAALNRSSGDMRLPAAKALAALGQADGFADLLAALDRVEAWDDKIFQGRMADYAYLPTPVDSLILALGWIGDRRATPAIARLARLLDAGATLSHHRSVALACERFGDRAAADVLVGVLEKPGMRGYEMTSWPDAGRIEYRTESLREITLARALYRCGDRAGLGRRILDAYADDWRGLFARHARAVLAAQG